MHTENCHARLSLSTRLSSWTDRMDAEQGYISRTPPGTCVAHDGSAVRVFAQVNDVRWAMNATAMAPTTADAAFAESLAGLRARSSRYSWYFRVRFALAPGRGDRHVDTSAAATTTEGDAACTHVSKMALFNPANRYSVNDPLGRYDVSNVPKLYFWSVTLPEVQTLIAVPSGHIYVLCTPLSPRR